MRPFIANLAKLAPMWISCYPNAGLPNVMGEYDETPDITASFIRVCTHHDHIHHPFIFFNSLFMLITTIPIL